MRGSANPLGPKSLVAQASFMVATFSLQERLGALPDVWLRRLQRELLRDHAAGLSKEPSPSFGGSGTPVDKPALGLWSCRLRARRLVIGLDHSPLSQPQVGTAFQWVRGHGAGRCGIYVDDLG